MNLKIGPYEINQRTTYSKLTIKNVHTGQNLEPCDIKDFNAIMKAYEEQTENPENFFVIDGDTLVGINPHASDYIDYFFIPEGITKIKQLAFSNRNMRMVSFPSTLETICSAAFVQCKNLEYVNIPDSVKEIESNAFDCCQSLVGAKLPNIDVINANLFSYCYALECIEIPDSVTAIENKAFSYCKSLTNVKLSKNLETINFRAFEDCQTLEKLDLPEGLKCISDAVFSNCYLLKDITIPSTVTELGERAFINCQSLENINIPEGITVINDLLFAGCEKLESLVLPDTVEEINSGFLSRVYNVTSINIPEKFNLFWGKIFWDCDVNTLIFNHSFESYKMYSSDDRDLLKCSNIKNLVINRGCKKIAPYIFEEYGRQIENIDYNGTKEEFEDFKKNNEELFKVLPNIKEVNILGKEIDEDLYIEESLR